MADYNIYIRTIGGESGEGSAVKPFQTGGGDASGDESQFISKAGAFLENPDSAIGAVKNAGVGTLSKAFPVLGMTILITGIALKVTDSILSKYYSYTSSASGDFNDSIAYSNFKQGIHNVFTPYSTAVRVQNARLEIRKSNARNEQEMLLTGGTILNSQYGRYL